MKKTSSIISGHLGKDLEVMYQTITEKRQLFHHSQTKKIIYGIQGGVGSFNEQAINEYFLRAGVQNYEIQYLFTSEKVLKALHKGEINFGLFALHNSIGGIVQESIEAMSHYKFQIIEEFFIVIRHFLMKRKDVEFKDIHTVMAHDQVFKQCKETIARKYPNLNFVTGEGDMRDHAKVAWALANNKIDSNIAVMGPEILSKIYDLDIIEKDLQDNKNNLTSFLLVKRG
jgi:prephenate dehydratase